MGSPVTTMLPEPVLLSGLDSIVLVPAVIVTPDVPLSPVAGVPATVQVMASLIPRDETGGGGVHATVVHAGKPTGAQLAAAAASVPAFVHTKLPE